MDPGAGPTSFDERFDELFAVAIRPAWRLLGSRDQAEDVAAEVLARALVRWRTLEASPQLPGWITTVSTNLAIQQLRKARRRPVPPPERGETISIDERLDLTGALATLPTRQRQVVVLRYFGDLSEADIAGTLGISVSSVKTHLARGLLALRNRLTVAEIDEARLQEARVAAF